MDARAGACPRLRHGLVLDDGALDPHLAQRPVRVAHEEARDHRLGVAVGGAPVVEPRRLAEVQHAHARGAERMADEVDRRLLAVGAAESQQLVIDVEYRPSLDDANVRRARGAAGGSAAAARPGALHRRLRAARRARGLRALRLRARAVVDIDVSRRARRRGRLRGLHLRRSRRAVREAAAADHPARGDRGRAHAVRARARRGALRRRDDRDGRRPRPLHRRGRGGRDRRLVRAAAGRRRPRGGRRAGRAARARRPPRQRRRPRRRGARRRRRRHGRGGARVRVALRDRAQRRHAARGPRGGRAVRRGGRACWCTTPRRRRPASAAG